MVEEAPGARKGSRKATRPRRHTGRRALALTATTTAAAIAWVVLVHAGITFGRSARGGESTAWIFMAIASLGAVACLFLALMLGLRAARAWGLGSRRPDGSAAVKGGKRRR